MVRYKFIFAWIYCSFSTLCQADWTISQPSPISTSYSYTYASVFTSCDPTRGLFLATWADGNNNQYPTYSFFTPGAGWSPINTISNSSPAVISSNVLTSCDRISGKFLASWTNITTNQPTSSVYSPGSGWSTADPLTTSTAAVNTANSFDSITGQFLITWADTNNNNYPTYSFYTPGTGWTPIATISTVSRAANVYSSFDSTTNQFLAVWVDIGSGNPMYSFYISGGWTVAAPISVLADVDNDVLCACNPATGQFLATWADINQNLYPFYSVYTPGSGWSPIATITTSYGVTDNVTISCDLTTGQFLASWSNVSNSHPTYSFYTLGTGWSQPAIISASSSSGSDITTSFNSMTGQFLAAWADTSNPNQLFNPTYSFFTYVLPTPPPPSHFTGSVLSNRFLTQTDIIHKLVWTPPPDASSIVFYQINRNGAPIAAVPASGPFVYDDHDRSKSKIDLYTIVSVSADGEQSEPLSMTL
jgi:hypothetical protein